MSLSGRYVAFLSEQADLVRGDTNGVSDLFVRDLASRTTTRVNVSDVGRQSAGVAEVRATVSGDGRRIAFVSSAADLVAGDTNQVPDVFVRDLAAGNTRRVSTAAAGGGGGSTEHSPVLTADGRHVALSSTSALARDDTNGASDVYLVDLQAPRRPADPYDFNGDGVADLAVGVPGEDLGEIVDAGAVEVLYGSREGVTSADAQLWAQDSPGVRGGSEPFDGFGSALAAGDFDRDGRLDLAVGVPGEALAEFAVGAVSVLYGTDDGLHEARDQFWTQDSPGVKGVTGGELGEAFGSSLAAGDLDGDGSADLAVGVPGDDVGRVQGAGTVNLLRGGRQGLTDLGDQLWHQDSPGLQGVADQDYATSDPSAEAFGSDLALADYDGDGHNDLAVAVRAERPQDCVFDERDCDAGALHVLFGDRGGLSTYRNQLWDATSAGIPPPPDDVETDSFASHLSAGDVDQDGAAELAVGGWWDDERRLLVLRGSPDGPTATGARSFADVTDAAIADLGRSGHADLVLTDDTPDSGRVRVLYGTSDGPTTTGQQAWDQDSPDVPGRAEPGDRFGVLGR